MERKALGFSYNAYRGERNMTRITYEFTRQAILAACLNGKAEEVENRRSNTQREREFNLGEATGLRRAARVIETALIREPLTEGTRETATIVEEVKT
jgi:hypothetical protein